MARIRSGAGILDVRCHFDVNGILREGFLHRGARSAVFIFVKRMDSWTEESMV